VHRGLRINWSYPKISEELERSTGEKLTRKAIYRYAKAAESKWARLREVQDEAAAFVAEIRAGNLSAEDIGTALIAQALFDTREALRSADPIQLAREQRERQKVGLKQQEIHLRERQVETTERKLAVLEAKQKAIDQQLAKAVAPENTELTEAEKAKIRSINGVEE